MPDDVSSDDEEESVGEVSDLENGNRDVETTPMGWGIVGTTGWADHTFAPAIRAGGGKLIGAAGSTPDGSASFARRHGAERTYPDIDELLADDDVQCVWVASPTDQHCDHALRALDAGKHVLVEKPMATSVTDAERMATAATHASVTTGVGFQHRFNRSHQHLRELSRTAELGDVVFIRLHQFIKADGLPSEWRRDPARSGGWAINDLGTHVLDLLRFIVGDVQIAGGGLAASHFDLRVDDLAVALMRFRTTGGGSGLASIEVSTAVPGAESVMELHGTEGVAQLTNSWPGGGLLRREGEEQTFEVVDTYAAQVRAFAAAASTGSKYAGASWDDGLANVRLVGALQQRGEVLFPEEGSGA